MDPLPPLRADEATFVRSELADTIWQRSPLEEPLFLKRYRSGARRGAIRQHGAQALIEDGSLVIVKDSESTLHAALTERGLRRLALALADHRAFPEARFSWLRAELARLLGHS
jgi:hypothetical protein